MQSLGNGGLDQISKQVGMSQEQTSSAMGAVVPVLLGAMAKNTATEEGASGLLGALDRDHDGSILDDLGGFIGNSESANGAGMLKHILGGQQSTVETGLASKVGVDSSSISKLLKIAAPLVMAYLGKEKRSSASSGFDAGGIGDLLGSLAGGSRQNDGLDIGDIMDLMGGLSGGGSSSGGGLLGSLLKGFTK